MSDKMFLLKYSEILAMLWEFKEKIDGSKLHEIYEIS